MMWSLHDVLLKFKPKISESDRALVASIKSLKTLRAVGGGVSIGAEDVEETMRALGRATRHPSNRLVTGEGPAPKRAEHIDELGLGRETLKYIRSYQPGASEINAAYERAKKAVEG